MIDKVVEFCARQRNEAASANSQYRVLQIGLGGGTLAPLVRSRCGALVDVIEKQQDVADAARRFMGYAGANSGTEERLIIASAVEGMRELRARAYDAIVIDCMVKGVIPPDCKSERFVSRAAHLLAPGGVITQWTWRQDYQLLSDRWRANFSKVTAQPYPGRALGGPGVLFVTNAV